MPPDPFGKNQLFCEGIQLIQFKMYNFCYYRMEKALRAIIQYWEVSCHRGDPKLALIWMFY